MKNAEELYKLSPFEKGMLFGNVLREETELIGANNTDELLRSQRYYAKLANRYRYAYRVEPLFRLVREDTKVLDAGCGWGTDSILCGLLGAEVVGIDLNLMAGVYTIVSIKRR
jgi:methylase of polypeptide subunit release factors